VSNDKPPSNNLDDASETTSIDEALAVLSRQYGRTVMLLDPFAGNHLLPAIDALTSPPARCLKLDDPIFKSDLQNAPLLVELLSDEPTHQDLLAQSILRAQEQVRNPGGPHHVCAWLFTDVPLKRLQRALRQRLDASYPKGERIYLRYFDPRVMPRLSVLLGSSTDRSSPTYSTLSQLLGPVRTWCHLNREGGLQRHDNPQPNDDVFCARLRFDEPLAAAINRIEAINVTARALIQRALPCKQSDDAVIDTHLVQAQSLGLHEADDLVAYAWRATQYGAAFTSQPGLHALITKAATHGIPFDALFESSFPYPTSVGVA
jgi:hypothetical protein